MAADWIQDGLATFEQILDLAGRSMHLRVADRNDLYPGWNTDGNGYDRYKRNHPYLILSDSVRHEMQRLGQMYRNSGRDLRTSAFWPLLKHQDAYVELFEYRRRVALTELTPKRIYDHLHAGNRVTWNGWVLFGGRPHESTDDFGQPVWRNYFYTRSPDNVISILDGLTKSKARAIFKEMTGHDYAGTNDLGFDRPHPAENVPWWMIRADGSVINPEEDEEDFGDDDDWPPEYDTDRDIEPDEEPEPPQPVVAELRIVRVCEPMGTAPEGIAVEFVTTGEPVDRDEVAAALDRVESDTLTNLTYDQATRTGRYVIIDEDPAVTEGQTIPIEAVPPLEESVLRHAYDAGLTSRDDPSLNCWSAWLRYHPDTVINPARSGSLFDAFHDGTCGKPFAGDANN